MSTDTPSAAAVTRGGKEILIDVQDVCLSLGGTHILEKVRFEVENRKRADATTGQIVALLGPSGVGKTRLFRIMAGLDPADSGVVHGRQGRPLQAGEVGVVFQHYPLLKHHTLRGNLRVAAEIQGLPPDVAEKRIEGLLARFGLSHRADFFPAQVSGGQRQRVAIAQQIVKPRELLLLDEPFSGLDPLAVDAVAKLLQEVAHANDLNTLVVVTHDISAALLVSDTLVLLGRYPGPDGKPAGPASVRKVIDLVAAGLAYRPGVELTPEFAAMERAIKAEFSAL